MHGHQNDSLGWTVASVIIAWLIYRLGIWTQRAGVLLSVQKELEMHSAWIDHEYTTNLTFDPSWKNSDYVVFKLTTTAIDNAICEGPTLFLNKRLIKELIGYKQRVGQFNQLVEEAIGFQISSGLWTTKQNYALKKRMWNLTCQIHWYGIGDRNQPLAYKYYQNVKKELAIENSGKLASYVWLLSNINLLGII